MMRYLLRVLALLLLSLFVQGRASATMMISMHEVGPDVVITASGTIDVTGMTYFGTFAEAPQFNPYWLTVGTAGNADIYGPLPTAPRGPLEPGAC